MRKEISIYIHIPFCVRKCNYCDFLSFPATEEIQDRYMQALLREIIREADAYSAYKVNTIFIGGGTPTSVKPEWIAQLLDCVRQNFLIAESAEISMEINPGTVTRESIAIYRSAGINRVSIGLQSGEDRELRQLGRIHTFADFEESYRWITEAGFANVNVDVMSALPAQTAEGYERTLEKVLHMNPPPAHISAYSLIVEEGTPFYDMWKRGELPLPEEDTERQMYVLTEEKLLSKGYRRYEISNYAIPGYECRHNKTYWMRGAYVGFGLGAASLIENTRFSNERELEAYLLRVEAGHSLVKDKPLSVKEQMEEFMFLGLRLTEGVCGEQFKVLFHTDIEEVYGEVIEKHRKLGLLQRDERIYLTPKGLDVSNYVMSDFLL